MITKNETCFVGVDVSKLSLDQYRPDTRTRIQFDNSQDGTEELCEKLKRKKKRILVVMEGTGG